MILAAAASRRHVKYDEADGRTETDAELDYATAADQPRDAGRCNRRRRPGRRPLLPCLSTPGSVRNRPLRSPFLLSNPYTRGGGDRGPSSDRPPASCVLTNSADIDRPLLVKVERGADTQTSLVICGRGPTTREFFPYPAPVSRHTPELRVNL